MQTLLRGVIPDSFPSQLAAKPTQEVGQRRFIIMDDNVYRLFGERVEQVDFSLNAACWSNAGCLSLRHMVCFFSLAIRKPSTLFSGTG